MKGADKSAAGGRAVEKPPGGVSGRSCRSSCRPATRSAICPALLPSLLSQHYPKYEVIVVDDQSTDGTPQILAEWAAA